VFRQSAGWRVALRAAVALPAFALAAAADAQQPVPARPDSVRRDSVRADTTRPAGDSARAAPRGPRRVRAAPAPRTGLEPPISPRRAFLSSLLVPGWGQARLERPSAGALFVAVELTAIALATKSYYDLRAAKAFRGDSIPVAFPVDTATGLPRPTPIRGEGPFPEDLVRARRVHLEDWLAVLAFNHLIAGAEAFVAANLWDLPAQVGAQRSRHGAGVSVRFRW
jgi:hypothetical protein